MPNDFIPVNRNDNNATKANLLLNYVTTLRQAYELGLETKAIMEHNNAASVFTDLEVLFGLQPGDGEAVYNMVLGSVAAIEGLVQSADAKNITERVG